MPLGGLEPWHGGGTRMPGGGRAGAPDRILHDFRDILRNIRNDMRKEIRIRILLKPPRGEDRRPTILE